MNVVAAAFGDDSAAARGEFLEVFLHSVKGVRRICRYTGGYLGGILRDDENRHRAVGPGMNGLLAGSIDTVHIGEHPADMCLADILRLQLCSPGIKAFDGLR